MAKHKERYMTVLGGYRLDMENHGHLVTSPLKPRIEGQDYGADPVGGGDVVDAAERDRRLKRYE